MLTAECLLTLICTYVAAYTSLQNRENSETPRLELKSTLVGELPVRVSQVLLPKHPL